MHGWDDYRYFLAAAQSGSLSFGLYAATEYLERCGEPRTQAELAGHDLITYSDSGAHLANAQWCVEQLRNMVTVLRSRSILVRAQAAANGLGITLLPRIVGRRWSRLAPVLPELAPPDLEIWLVVHRDLRSSARIRVVMDFLVELFARE